jgi:quinol-cytochrome oxidoreductase complex cytochrome b subunit
MPILRAAVLVLAALLMAGLATMGVAGLAQPLAPRLLVVAGQSWFLPTVMAFVGVVAVALVVSRRRSRR